MEIEPNPNKEVYHEVRKDDEVVSDDEDLVLQNWKANCDKCPFPGCSEQSFERAKAAWWSMDSHDKVLEYMKNHAKSSTLHCKSADWNLSNDEVDVILRTVDVVVTDQTFADRQQYKKQIDVIEEKKKGQQQQDQRRDHKRWKSSESHWDHKSGGWYSDWDTNFQKSGGDGASSHDWPAVTDQGATIDHLTARMKELSESVTALQMESCAPALFGPPAEPMPPVFTPPVFTPPVFSPPPASLQLARQPGPSPGWAVDHVGRNTASAWDPSMSVAVQERTITLPYSQLLLFKESMDRAREAGKSTMAAMCVALDQLRNEIGIMNNAEAVMHELLEKGKRPA
jgi:hypothetical protein